MNSIPRTASFHHQSISTTVAGAVTELPVTLDDLVADYADESGFAELRFELDHQFRLLDNDTNKQIRAAIKNILTGEDEPGKKRTIFKNAELWGPKMLRGAQLDDPPPLRALTRHRDALSEILNEIRTERQQINLNYVDFTDIDLQDLNLNGASAIAAKFDSSVISQVSWKAGDFTGALFRNMTIDSCSFSEAIMHKAFFTNSLIEACWLNRVDMFKVIMNSVKFNFVIANQIETYDEGLLKLIIKDVAAYDESGRLASSVFQRLSWNQQFFLSTYFELLGQNKISILQGTFSSSGGSSQR